MKAIFVGLFILFAINALGQEKTNNFILNNDKTVSWQKVYPLDGSIEELKNKLDVFFKNQKFTSNLEYLDSSFIGNSNRTNVAIQRGNRFVNSGDFTCYIKIELKENKYRVTIKNIVFEPVSGGINTGGIILTSNVSYSFGDYTVKNNKNEFRKNKPIQDMITSFNNDFDKYFSYTETEKSDW
ncbi:hypothetical protein ACT3CE_16355 [Marinifilum sp. RC60d5]|uniref:hypothetical protein n=1 Tax=Marinifilum sp. RC60d5 TaxID=3458414 RepID=UPI0040373290